MFQKLDSILPILKTKGLRITPARVAVLEILVEQNGPISHQQIEGILEQHDSRIDRVTIYRTLHTLTECGILHKVMGIDRSYSYAYKMDDFHKDQHGTEHPHFVCERCSHTFCLPEVEIPSAISTPSGFELKYTEVKLFGYCPECI